MKHVHTNKASINIKIIYKLSSFQNHNAFWWYLPPPSLSLVAVMLHGSMLASHANNNRGITNVFWADTLNNTKSMYICWMLLSRSLK